MRCGCGRMFSTTAGQTLTTSSDPDAQARLLRMTACRTDVRSRQDRNVKLTDMTRVLYISPGTERSIVRDHVDYGEVCVRCVLQLTLYASHRELFVLWVNHTKPK